MRRKGDKLTDEQRKKALDDIIYFFESEREEQIGQIAAEQVLNFFQETIGAAIYNRGIMDAKRALESRVDELKYDLDDLIES